MENLKGGNFGQEISVRS